MNFHAASRQGTPLTLTSRKGVGHAKSRKYFKMVFFFLFPRTTQLWREYRVCPVRMYVRTYVCTFVRSYVHLLSSL